MVKDRMDHTSRDDTGVLEMTWTKSQVPFCDHLCRKVESAGVGVHRHNDREAFLVRKEVIFDR